MREAAIWVVERSLAGSSPADVFLEGVRSRCQERDLGLLHELVRGTLTWLRRLDHVLETAASRPMSKIEVPLHGPLRLGVYQLLFLDRMPSHAIVNEAVEHAHRTTHRGGASFTNGVLRRIARSRDLAAWPVEERDEVRRLGIEHSHPDFLVARWLDRFGVDGASALLRANNRRKSLHLLTFREHGGREVVAEQLIDEGLEVVASDLAPLGLRVASAGMIPAVLGSESFRTGRFYVQDEASQVAALVPPPQRGERILDLAAAPGGKLFSQRSYQPGAAHVGSDVALDRLLRLRANQRRLRLDGPLVVADGRSSPFAPVFDRVVVDGPCSGTGTLRKNPEIRWRLDPGEIDRLAADGVALLRGASRAVRPGGLLVWITCSLEREENEDVTAAFRQTEEGRGFQPVRLEEALPPCLQPHVTGPGSWRLLTAADHDGFSVEVLRRDA